MLTYVLIIIQLDYKSVETLNYFLHKGESALNTTNEFFSQIGPFPVSPAIFKITITHLNILSNRCFCIFLNLHSKSDNINEGSHIIINYSLISNILPTIVLYQIIK